MIESQGGSISGHVNGKENGHINGRTNGYATSKCTERPVMAPSQPEPVAIVGMAMRLPGDIHTSEALWELLINNKTTRGPVPRTRYNSDGFFTASGRPGSTGVRHGHFLSEDDGIDVLDTSFFNLSKSEVEKLDPQQRMLLEVVWECAENAGQQDWRGSSTGVFVGAWGYDWVDFLAKDPQQVGGLLNVTGSHDYTLANRVSYEYNLQGPSMTIKTACSSSMICVHQAVQALRNEECDAAIVAGTNLIITPTQTIEQTEAGVLSPTGECRTFDADANGYARGEAINALLLKKLSKAIEDEDTIRAVIRSTAVNSDGRSAGLSTPNPKAHARLMQQAYRAAGLNDPSDTPYVEVHGTGTKTGDPLELEAIAEVFGREQETYVGGVKANLGHSESASGITSIIKAVVALEKRVIPPQANFKTPNPRIAFEEARLIVPLKPTPWPEDRPERVSVNSFGITGANAHAVIESAACYAQRLSPVPEGQASFNKESELLLVSATSVPSLRERCTQMQDYVTQHPNLVADLAYTLACRRYHMPHRAYCIISGLKPAEFVLADRSKHPPKLTFVFTGQGAQWPAMGKELIEQFPTFRGDIAQMGNALGQLQQAPSWDLLDEIMREGMNSRVNKAEFAQPLSTAIQIALVNLLRTLGVVPSAVVGHSSGEIAAAYAAGAVTSGEAIVTAYYRGLATTMCAQKGAMAAVGLSQAEGRLYLERGVVVACDNSPQSITISGDEEALECTLKQIKQDDPNVFTRRLKTDGMAYHSHHMTEIGSTYEEYLRSSVKATRPTVRFYSSITGKLEEDLILGPEYWRRNLESPVRFYPAVRSILQDQPSDQLFLEVGPHSALAGPLRQIFKASASKSRLTYCSSLVRGVNSRESILDMAGQLHLQLIPLNLRMLTTGSHSLTDIPIYPWNHSISHWTEPRAVKDWRSRKFPPHELLGSRVLEGNDLEPTWRNMLRLNDNLWLTGHKVYDDVVFPCAGYIAMAGEAVRQLTEKSGYTIRNLNVKTAMVFQDNAVEIMTSLRGSKSPQASVSGWYDFAIVSYNGSTWAEHCNGEIQADEAITLVDSMPESMEALPRRVQSPYDAYESVGLHYDGFFQGLEEVSTMPGRNTAVATLKRQAVTDSYYALHPTTIDHCLQLLGMASSEGMSRRLTHIPLPTLLEQISVQPAKMQDRLRAKAVANHTTKQGDIEGEMVVVGDESTVLAMTGCHLSGFEDRTAVTLADDPIAAARVSWRPHIDFVQLDTLMVSHEKDPQHLINIEQYGLLCSAEILDRIRDTQDSSWHFSKFRRWMEDIVAAGRLGQNEIVTASKQLLELDNQERLHLMQSLREQLRDSPFVHFAELTTRLLDNCIGIFNGTIEVLEVYFKDDALTKLYAFTGDRIDASEFFITAGHSNPTLRVLEIGAGTGGTTLVALNALTAIKGEPLYASYTFTDISSGFFSAAKERFKHFPGLEFKTLDIGRDPGEQGFELGTYDLIVASNVIHATERLNATLKNVRKLLSPGGRFFLQELTPGSAKTKNLIMGPLPGWWLGEADGRVDEPIITVERWDSELRAAGFFGIECVVRDDPRHAASFGANMIAKPLISPKDYKSVTILVGQGKGDATIVEHLQQAFVAKDYFVDICTFGEAIPPSQDIVSIVEVDEPLFDKLSAADLLAFQKAVAGLSSARMLWVLGSAQVRPNNAHFGLTLGMVRCIRAEMSTPLATLEVDRFDASTSEVVLRIFEKFLETASTERPDLEYVITENVVKVGRYHWSNVSRELEASQDTTNRPLKLAVDDPRTSKSMIWVPQPDIELASEEVLLRSLYVDLGHKCSRSLEENAARGYVAEVIQVGTSVDSLQPGDYVMTFGSHGVATRFKIAAGNAVRVPESWTLEYAATVPLAYATALFCLKYFARLQKNDAVLIVDACSSAGIAAVRVCHSVGVKAHLHVLSKNQVTYLAAELGALDDVAVTCEVTEQSTVDDARFDVVLNLLPAQLEKLSRRLTTRGKLINVCNNQEVDMNAFAKNIVFFNVDMADMDDLSQDLLQEAISLVQQQGIGPLQETRVLDLQGFEAGLQSLDNDDMRMLLLKLPTETTSLAIQPPVPILEFQRDASYLIAGGLGGLGRAISTCMAEHGARHFTYLSRSAGSTAHEPFFRELEAQGCTVQAIPCDISSPTSVRSAVQQVELPIAGVLQMAMALQDRPFLSMTLEDWTTAIKPKVDGTWNLHTALIETEADLDFFVMFGSISGAFGFPGQGNYAAGNSFQDAFTQYRHSLGLPASVLDVGVMADAGYVSQNKDVHEYFRTAGMPLLTEGQLFEALHLSILQQHPSSQEERSILLARSGSEAGRGLGSASPSPSPGFTSRSQLTLGVRATKPMTDPTNRVLWKRDRKADIYRNIEAARLSNCSTTATGSTSGSSGDDELAALMTSLRAAAAASSDPTTTITTVLGSPETMKLVRREIGAFVYGSMLKAVDEEADMEYDRSLMTLGVDSLVTVEVRSWLRRKFNVELSTLEMLNGGTIEVLASLVLERLKSRFVEQSTQS